MRTTVLTANGVPADEVSVQEAIVKIVLEKAYAVENYPNRVFRSPSIEIPAPRTIAVFRYVSLPDHFYGPAPLSNRHLFLRDDYTCQYCGRGRTDLAGDEFLTRDHLFPVSRGGEDRWENCVTACVTCNHQKADRTPSEANLAVLSPPRVPKLWEMFDLRRERRAAHLQRSYEAGTLEAVAV